MGNVRDLVRFFELTAYVQKVGVRITRPIGGSPYSNSHADQTLYSDTFTPNVNLCKNQSGIQPPDPLHCLVRMFFSCQPWEPPASHAAQAVAAAAEEAPLPRGEGSE